MDIRSAQLFMHLSASLNFAKTSTQLYVSPSTLTRVIQRLEEELGVSLFQRDQRSVKLTPAGQRFQGFVSQYLADWQQLQIDLATTSDLLQGEIKLFCSVTASYSHLPMILDKFRVLCPKAEIKLTTGDAALAIEKIKNGEADIALAVYPPNLPLNLAFNAIAQIPLQLIAPVVPCKITELLNQSPISWAQIPFILPEHGPMRSRLDTWFKQLEITPNIVARVEGHEAMVSMVALGTGVALAPDVVVQHSSVRDRVRVLSIAHQFEPFELGICIQSKKLHEPLMRTFWQIAGQR